MKIACDMAWMPALYPIKVLNANDFQWNNLFTRKCSARSVASMISILTVRLVNSYVQNKVLTALWLFASLFALRRQIGKVKHRESSSNQKGSQKQLTSGPLPPKKTPNRHWSASILKLSRFFGCNKFRMWNEDAINELRQCNTYGKDSRMPECKMPRRVRAALKIAYDPIQFCDADVN